MTPTVAVDGERNRSVLIAFAVVFFATLALVLDRKVPLIAGDELGYLAAGRYFAGQGVFNMLTQPYYPFGYGLTLAPLFFVLNDPRAVYGAAIAMNCAFVAAAVPLGATLLDRFGIGRGRWQLVVCGICAFWPSFTSHAGLVWSEAFFRLIFLSLIVGAGQASRYGTLSSTLWVAVATVILYATHMRSLALLPISAVFILANLAIDTRRWRNVLLALLVLVAGSVAVGAIHQITRNALWFDSGGSSLQGLLADLLGVGGGAKAMAGMIGQVWYQLTASFALVMVGAFVVVRQVVHADQRRVEVVFAAFFILAIAGIAAASVGQMLSAVRLDHLVYGRYLDGGTMPLLLLGVAGAMSFKNLSRWALALASVLITVGAVVVYGAAVSDGLSVFHYPNVAGVAALVMLAKKLGISGLTAFVVVPSVVAVAAAAAMFGLVVRRLPILAALACYAVSSSLILADFFHRTSHAMEARVAANAMALQASDQIFLDPSAWHDLFLFRVRYLLPDIDWRPVSGRTDELPKGSIVAMRADQTSMEDFCHGRAGDTSVLVEIGRNVQPLRLEPNVAVDSSGVDEGQCQTGWHPMEIWGRWSSSEAFLIVSVPPTMSQPTLELLAHGFGEQTVRVSVNGVPTTQWVLSGTPNVVELPLPHGIANIRFELPSATSPAAAGASSDARVLALGLRSLCLSSAGEECL